MRLPSLVALGIALLIASNASVEIRAERRDSEAELAAWQNIQAEIESLRLENASLHERMTELEAGASPAFASTARHSDGCTTMSGCGCCRQGGFGAGGGVYFLKPHWTNNPAYGIFVGLPVSGEVYSQTDFDWNVEAAWDVYGEYTGSNGFGVRARYWQFDQGVDQQSILGNPFLNEGVVLPRPFGLPVQIFGGPVPFRFQSGLEMEVVDFEALQRLGRGAWFWEFSGGLRWSSVEQNYRGGIVGFQNNFVALNHDFEGIGPLLAIEGRRRLFDSRLSVFGKGRGSVLFGDADAAGLLGRVDNMLGLLVDSTSSYSRHHTISVVELELGASYEKPVGAAMAFLEVAFYGSAWLGAGNASYSSPLEGAAPSAISDQPGFGTSTGDDLGLIGGRLTAGFRH